jgi:hypothetical protein
MSLTKVSPEVVEISEVSLALVSDTTAGGINIIKANINDPNFTGIPTAPTADPDTNTTQLATTEFVNYAIANRTSSSSNNAKIFYFA